MMDVRASLNTEENIAIVTGDGSATAVENDSFFAKVPPLAASTVGRNKHISRRLREVEQEMGSFLDDSPKRGNPRRPDLTQPSSLLFGSSAAYTDLQIDALGSQLAAQIKKSMRKGDPSADEWNEPDHDDSTSLGILNVDNMDMLSNDLLLETPIEELMRRGDSQQSYQVHDTPPSVDSQSTIKGASSDSNMWRDDGSSTAFQDSKGLSSDNDSKPEPFALSNIGTVKKYPSAQTTSNKAGPMCGMGPAIRQSLFAGLAMGEVAEEGETSMYNVELEADDLHQLDTDFGEIDCSVNYDSDHEEFQPRASQATLGEDQVLDSIYLRPGLTANGDGEDDKSGLKHTYLSKVSLFDENGNDFSNSGSEQDTEDELDLMRKAQGMRREIAGEASHAQLARPGLEGGCASEQPSGVSSSHLPMTQRQSAEGDVVSSPVPGDGGGGGDGSSGSDSDGGRTQGQTQYTSASRDLYRRNDVSVDRSTHRNQGQRIRPMGDDLLSEMRFSGSGGGQTNNTLPDGEDTRLQSRYLLAISSTDNTSVGSFNIDDFLSSRNQSGDQEFDPGNRLEASGFNADDNQRPNAEPFGNMASSFGSFGLDGSQPNTSLVPGMELGSGFSFDAGDRFPETSMNVRDRLTGEAAGRESGSGEAGLDASGGDPWQDMVGSNRTSLASRHSSMGQYSRVSPRQGLSPVYWSGEGGHGVAVGKSSRSPSRSSGGRRSPAQGSPASSVSSPSLAGSDQNLYKDDFGDNDGFKKPLPPPPKSMKTNMTRSKVSIKPLEPATAESGDQATGTAGEYVDLALRVSLSSEAAEQRERLKRVPSIGGSSQLDLTVPDSEFFNNDAALAMLDADEESYDKENIIRQDDAMLSQSSGSPDDSWAYRSIMSIARPSWLEDPNDAEKIRISVGTFMRSRTGALGSLDGDENVPRPDFGITVVTPPRDNHRPSRLIDVTEENIADGNSDSPSQHGGGAGVGDETLTMESLDKHPGEATLNLTMEMEKLGIVNKTVMPDTSALTMEDVSMFFKSVKTADPTQLGQGLIKLQMSKHRTDTQKLSDKSSGLNTSQLPIRKGSNVSRSFPKVGDSEKSVLRSSSARQDSSRSCADSGFKSESVVSSVRDSDLESTKDSKLQDKSELREQEKSSQSSYCADTSELMNKLDDFRFLVSANIESAKQNRSARLEQVTSEVGVGEHGKVADRGVPRDSARPGSAPQPVESLRQTSCQYDDYDRETPPPDGQAARRDTGKSSTISSSVSKPISPQLSRKPAESLIDELKRMQAIRISKSDGEIIETEVGGRVPKVSDSEVSERKISGRPGVAMNESRYRTKNQKGSLDNVSRSGLDRGDRSGFVPDHHIPDGTEYSQRSEVHMDRKGISRDNLVGTEDIGLADSRGFNAIRPKTTNPNQASQLAERSARGDLIPSERQHMVTALNDRDNQIGVHLQSKSKRSLNLQPAQSASPPTRNSAHVPVSTRDMATDIHKNVETQTFPNNKLESWTQTSVVLRESVGLQPDSEQLRQAEQRSELPHVPNTVPEPDNKNTTDSRKPPLSDVDHRRQMDEVKHSEKPVLLSRDSLMHTQFAQEYLKRDLSLEVMDRIYGHSQQSFQQMDASNTNTTANMSHLRESEWTFLNGNTMDTISELPPKFNEVTHLGHDLTNQNFHPTAQSTPFVQNTVPKFNRLPGSNVSVPASVTQYSMTTLTPSSMHTLSSTGFTGHAATDGDLSSQLPHTIQGRSSLCPVEAPAVVEFPDTCCLGISKKEVLVLKNPTGNWLECNVEVRSVELDGHPTPVENSPFTMRHGKVIIDPYKTATVDVMFIPKMAGAYVAKVNVYTQSFLRNKTGEKNVIPVSTTFQAVAEEPRIQVTCDGEEKELIHFGEIPWGQCREKMLNIRNLGTATVPLRLAINSNGSWHCFSFESVTGTSDISSISGGRLPLMSRQGVSITTLCLPAADSQLFNHHSLKVWCWPPDKNCDQARMPAEELSCEISIELDIPCSKFPMLRCLRLKAIIGIQKLHIQANLQELQLSCAPKKERATGVSIYNAGNLTLNVAFGFSAHKDVFSVSPLSCILQPGVDTEITVTFRPPDRKTAQCEVLLLMLIQPKGPMFELKVQGNVTAEPEVTDLNIQCDCTNLDFGGVAIGKNSVKRFRLLSMGTEPVTMMTEVRADDFMLLKSPDPTSTGSRVQEIRLEPNMKTPVYVLYSPTTCSTSTNRKIVMKAVNYSKRFTVYLSGYGGVSKLCCAETTAELTSVAGHPCIGVQSLTMDRVKHLYINNLGSQLAIVKVNAYRDLQCQQRLSAGELVVQPSDFLIASRGQQHVELVFSMSDDEFTRNCQSHKVGGALMFSYRDQVDSKKPHTSSLTVGLVRSDSRVSNTHQIPADAFATPSRSSHAVSRPSHFPQTVLENPRGTMDSVKMDDRTGDDRGWSVRPEELVLDCSNRTGDGPVEKFYIYNDRNTDISFELFLQGGMLSLNPDRGIVKARETKWVRVTPSDQCYKCLDQLPWSGSIMVTCEDNVKKLRVKLGKGVDNIRVGDDQSMVPVMPAVPQVPLISPRRLGNLEVSRTVVEFPGTCVGATSGEVIELRNVGSDMLRWMFLSFASTYLKKKSDNHKDMFRLSYKVFEFSHQFGKLGGNSSVQVAIKFMPRSAGTFTQYWDVQATGSATDTAATTDEHIRFHFIGEGIEEDEVKTKMTMVLEDVLPRTSDHHRLKLDKDTLVFPSIGAGATITQKVEFKNSYVEDVKVEVIAPKPPFSIRHTNFMVAKKRYLRFPVEFRPTRPGKYSDEVRFQGSRGDNVVLKVHGECC